MDARSDNTAFPWPFRREARLASRGASVAIVAAALMAGAAGCDESALPPPTAASAQKLPSGLTDQQARSVVAKVGDREITLGEYAITLERMNRQDATNYQTKEKRRELLQERIDLELLAQEARRRGLDKRPDVQDAVRQVLREAAVADARAKLPQPSEVSAEDVAAYYNDHRDRYVEPPRRRITAIVLGDEDKAKEVLKEVLKMEKPSEWGDLFFAHSLTASDTRPASSELAGDLGMVTLPVEGQAAPKSPVDASTVPREVMKAAFELKTIGDVYPRLVHEPATGPEHPDRYYIVRLVGLSNGHTRTLSEAEASIRVAILQDRLKVIKAETEAKLRKKYQVKIDEDAINDLGVLPAKPATKP